MLRLVLIRKGPRELGRPLHVYRRLILLWRWWLRQISGPNLVLSFICMFLGSSRDHPRGFLGLTWMLIRDMSRVRIMHGVIISETWWKGWTIQVHLHSLIRLRGWLSSPRRSRRGWVQILSLFTGTRLRGWSGGLIHLHFFRCLFERLKFISERLHGLKHRSLENPHYIAIGC